MRILPLLLVLLIIPILNSCGPIDPPPRNSLISDEDKLRMELHGTWTACLKMEKGSSLVVLDITKGNLWSLKKESDEDVRLYANLYGTANCSGDDFQTFPLAGYSYSAFTTLSSYSGQAKINLVKAYNHAPKAQAKFLRFEDSFLVEATASFAIDPRYSSLRLELNQLMVLPTSELSRSSLGNLGMKPKPKMIPQVVSLEFVKFLSGSPIPTRIGKFSYTYMISEHEEYSDFDSFHKAFLNLADSSVDKNCFDSFMKSRAYHDQLKLGCTATSPSFYFEEDEALKPWLHFYFGFECKKLAQKENFYEVNCSLTDRVQGIRF